MNAKSIKPIILFHDVSWGLGIVSLDPLPCCDVITNLDRLPEAHAVVFHIPTAPDLTRIRKYAGQIWVALSMESEVNYPLLLNLEFMRRFDLTMTYRLDSDIPSPYFGAQTCEALLRPPRPKVEQALAVYFASNASDRCGRYEYIQELMKYLELDSYGACLNNRKLPDDRGTATKLDTIARYKFTLAFENSIAHDYVTEKLFEPLIAGSVPVYRGAPNIEDFAPGERCFIDAAQFAGPRELAEYLLALAGNEAEYQSYLKWKTQPLALKFVNTAQRFSVSPPGRLCAGFHLEDGILRSSHVQCDPIHKILRALEQKIP